VTNPALPLGVTDDQVPLRPHLLSDFQPTDRAGSRDALGRTSRAEQMSQAFTLLGSVKLILHVRYTHERHSLRRLAWPLCAGADLALKRS
jgi:hypothetical protein